MIPLVRSTTAISAELLQGVSGRPLRVTDTPLNYGKSIHLRTFGLYISAEWRQERSGSLGKSFFVEMSPEPSFVRHIP
jgi:hypothetical protein